MQLYISRLVPKAPFAVAVSGGVDSVVLAHILSKKFIFTIFHYNHNLRPQNEDMEESVKIFARDLKLPFCTLKREFKPEKVSEADLREDRIAAFKLLQRHILTGHHLDDAVESYMMNCMEGTPSYMPIPTSSSLGADYKMYRPLIATPKAEIIKYAEANDLMQYVVEDETNTDERMFRNKVRHNIVEKFPERGLHTVVRKRFYDIIDV